MVEMSGAWLVIAIGCGHPADSTQAVPPPHESPPAARRLGTQPLEGTIPDDAGIKDINAGGPDDAGFHGACVILHASGPSNQPWECGGVNIIQDTTQGRRIEDAHIRFASMEEELAGLRHVTRSDHIADGWIIEHTIGDESYVDGGLVIKPGTERYAIIVHRTIAGTPWACGFVAQSRAELAEVERLCISIRAPH
jgi:hypothetical protein